MGTSKSSSGEVHTNPLVPSWIEREDSNTYPIDSSENTEAQEMAPSNNDVSNTENNVILHDKPKTNPPDRLKPSRIQFNKFIRAKGSNVSTLKKAVSKYISKGMKGSGNLSRRMKPEKNAATKVAGILWQASNTGIRNVFPEDKYPLMDLSNLHVREIYTLFVEEVVSSSGTVDANLIRDAYLNTIQEISPQDDSLLENPSPEVRIAFLEAFIANTIFERILHSLGNGIIKFSASAGTIAQKEEELKDLIQGTVEDIMSDNKDNLTTKKMSSAIDSVYDKALSALESMGEE